MADETPDESSTATGMSPQTMKLGRVIVLTIWAAAALAFFPPFSTWATGPLLRALFGMLAAVHFVEFFVYLKTFRETEESLLLHFAKTMAYGVLHYTHVKRQLGT